MWCWVISSGRAAWCASCMFFMAESRFLASAATQDVSCQEAVWWFQERLSMLGGISGGQKSGEDDSIKVTGLRVECGVVAATQQLLCAVKDELGHFRSVELQFNFNQTEIYRDEQIAR